MQDTRGDDIDNLTSRELLLHPFLTSITFARADGVPPFKTTKIPNLDNKWIDEPISYLSSLIIKGQWVTDFETEVKWRFIAYLFLEYPRELFEKDGYIRGRNVE